ncbi:MFS transporter [Acidiplasma cupricumulans]|uniref:Amino acid transporter n=1 Tax=Acidiplasma cupricumulans TaxID=312540 RepID=A0A0Q0XLA7_9ARCH|nr:MFS transporter [Acidiplasma cupricumulans]KQB36095.1 amino acid transporter [Acidiplasma cupricumulans]
MNKTKNRYIIYLTVVAMAGWMLASFDFNIMTPTLPLISKSLHFTTEEAGLITGVIYLGMFVMVLIYGPLIDKFGRKVMFQIVLTVSAIFTGFTYLVVNFLQFMGVRFIADGSAFGELPTGLTIVTEESSPKLRGILYGFIQGGWPIGLFISSAAYLLLVSKIGWRGLYLLGLIPLIAVIIARFRVKESDRFKDLKKTITEDTKPKYAVNKNEAKEFPYKQLFNKDLRKQFTIVNLGWMLYTFSFVTTNVVIALIFTSYYKLNDTQSATILLIASGIGFFAYPIAGWYGQIIGRRNAWVMSSILMPFTALIFYIVAVPGYFYSILIPYIFLYFFSNGTFASVGFMYASESFPTRARGSATSFIMALIAASYAIGGFLFSGILSLTSSIPITWIILAVILPFGSTVMILGKNIKPDEELESIST